MLDRLVGDTDHARVEQRVRQRRVRGEVQVGEEHLALAQPADLVGLRLLHLHDQVGLRPGLLARDQRGARLAEARVGEAAALPCAALDQQLVTVLLQHPHRVGHETDAKLHRLGLARNADPHPYLR
jgi:hypothetical protein